MNYNKIEYEKSFGTSAQLSASDMPEIAFSGRSNVGKSSLINKLFNRKNLARVSSVPGKTTTVNFFKSDDVRFVDLPGYGFAKRSESERIRWADLMEGYFNTSRPISLVVQLVDMRHPATADDRDMLAFLENTGYKYIIILTKCDKLNKTQRLERRESVKQELGGFSPADIIEFSAQTGEGVNRLKEAINSNLQM